MDISYPKQTIFIYTENSAQVGRTLSSLLMSPRLEGETPEEVLYLHLPPAHVSETFRTVAVVESY